MSYAFRVLHYLYSTKDFKLEFKKRKNGEKRESALKKGESVAKKYKPPQLTAFVDADFAGDIETRKSTTGMIICVNGMPVYWRSKLQTSVATATAEAEIIALFDVVQELSYYRIILDTLGFKQETTKVHEDNQAAIAIMTRPEKKTRMRHLETKYFKIQDAIGNQMISLEYVKTENNVADLMTKALNKPMHMGIMKRLGMTRG